MFTQFRIYLILALLIPSPLVAQGDVLTFEEAIAEALSVNLDIQAAQYRSTAAKARIPQAKALDDPMVGITFEDVPIDTIDVNRGEKINYRAQQNLPFPGKRYVRGKAARFDARAVEETSRGQIGDVLLDLKRTYYTLYQIDRSLEVNGENQRLLRQFLGSAETWYATGKATADAPLKAQVELSKLKNEEILLEQQRITHQAHLKAKLNRTTHEEIRLPSRLKWPRLTLSTDEVKSMPSKRRPQ